jgi:hypothetical protein
MMLVKFAEPQNLRKKDHEVVADLHHLSREHQHVPMGTRYTDYINIHLMKISCNLYL